MTRAFEQGYNDYLTKMARQEEPGLFTKLPLLAVDTLRENKVPIAGAGIGALLGLLTHKKDEKLSDKENKKNKLKRVLSGLLIGATGGAGFETLSNSITNIGSKVPTTTTLYLGNNENAPLQIGVGGGRHSYRTDENNDSPLRVKTDSGK